MSDYKVEYDGVDAGSSTAKVMSNQTGNAKSSLSDAKNILNDESVFMGPVKDNVIQEVSALESDFTSIETQYQSIGNYLQSANATYKKGDSSASSTVGLSTSGSGTRVNIPSDVVQAGYTVTCYGEGGWYLGGGSTPTAVASGTKQKSVHEAWLADGARYKDGIAVMKVNGQDHYLIATAPTLGSVGDSVNVNLQNGQTVPCVIADAKSTNDSNYTTYGHGRSDGSVNVLEFEVDRNKYNSSGNPTTSTWGLEWDSSSGVSSVDNQGSII